ncbi:hypothetical protein N7540_006499 [Penicillium herquei]|nr:hypothetical protein N7540_006499 [Penicillium herquei]
MNCPVSADEAYLGEIISLLGPPSPELLSQGKKASHDFDTQNMLSTIWDNSNFLSLSGKRTYCQRRKKWMMITAYRNLSTFFLKYCAGNLKTGA